MTERKGRVDDRNSNGDEQQGQSHSAVSKVVFYGDSQLVSDAFALALKAMETSADVLTAGSVAAKPKTLDD